MRWTHSPPLVHWLRLAPPVHAGTFEAKRPSYEVACGVALTADQARWRTSKLIDDVTCEKCRRIEVNDLMAKRDGGAA